MSAVAAFLPATLALAFLVLGLGGAVQRLSGRTMPLGAIPAAGLAALVVVGQFATLVHLPAIAAGLIAVAGAGAGLLWLPLRRLPAADPAAASACAVAGGIFLGAVALTGQATFGGYTQLADTAVHLLGATYLPGGAPDHLGGAAGAIWRAYYETGYPTGGAATLGMLSALTATAPTHALQPLLAVTMATVSASAWVVLAPFVTGRAARAIASAAVALPGLTFGFAMQGSLKEVVALAMLVGTAAVLPEPSVAPGASASGWRADVRAALPAAVVVAGLVAAIGAAAGVYLLPLGAIAAMAWARAGGLRRAAVTLGGLVASAAALSVPTLIALRHYLEVSGRTLTLQNEKGNLASALLPKRALSGIWLGPDFRQAPTYGTLSAVLADLALLAAAAGFVAVAIAWWRRPSARTGGAAGWIVGGAVSVVLVVRVGSPWADWKGYAIFTPAMVAAAAVGLAAVGRWRPARWPAVAAGGLLALGLAGTVALAAGSVPAAPQARFAELDRIDRAFAGRGPLFTAEREEFDRVLLRDTDVTFAGDPFNGIAGAFPFAGSGDTDGLDPAMLERFRLILVRTGPRASRPPGQYVRRFRGRFYEVWERDPRRAVATRRLPLGGDGGIGASVPTCPAVEALAAAAGPGQVLRAAEAPAVDRRLAGEFAPRSWPRDADGTVHPERGATVRVTLRGPASAPVDVWLEAQEPRTLTVDAGGAHASIGPATFGPAGSAVRLLTTRTAADGSLTVTIRRPGGSVRPGSSNHYARWTAVALTTADPLGTERVTPVDPADHRAVAALCTRPLDWLELAARR